MQQVTRPLRVTSSPHVRATHSTKSIMIDVIIALIPAGAFGVYHFGIEALWTILITVASAVIWEALIQKALKKPITTFDMSAVVTGLILAYNLPASVPMWLPIIGSGIAIVLVKQLFGGLGHNFMNPALAARAVLMASWMGLMTSHAFIEPDIVSSATPLATNVQAGEYTLTQLFIGNVPGCIGEVSKLGLLVGGIYLIVRGVIDWRTPLAMIATSFVLFLINSGQLSGTPNSAMYQLFSGGLILGAFFMATDYATTPVTSLGRIVFGVGTALLVFIIRVYNDTYPEGVSYAILIMNCVTPLIDKFVKPKIYGEAKRNA